MCASQPPPAPGDVRLLHGITSREVVVRCAPSAGASSYQYQRTLDPNAGPWTDGGASTNTRHMVIASDLPAEARILCTGEGRTPLGQLPTTAWA